MRRKHYRTWIMVSNTQEHGKYEMHTGVWRETLESMKNEKHTL